MPSSQSSSHSPGEEAYLTAEEDHSCYAQSSSGASSIVTSTPNGSVYATANQTPVASPGINRGTASSAPIVAQDQHSYDAIRPIEESLEERREKTPTNVMPASSASLFNHRAEASTYLERQRELFMQQAELRESEKEEEIPDSPTRGVPDESSRIWASGSPPLVNDGRHTGLADAPESNYIERRATNDISYPYRPTAIDVDPQQQLFFSTLLPFNNTSPLVPNRNNNTHQGLAPIKEDEMPYDVSGNFIMNPEAPVFVPRQPAMAARSPRDEMHQGVTPPNADQAPAAPPNSPNASPTTQQIPLYGAAHGMFFDPTTGMFTGDGPPRTSPYRPDGTLPSQPDLESDFLTKRHYPRRAEDQLHIQPRSEYNERMAGFGKNGPIETFRIARPLPQGPPQQATRVVVREEGEGSTLFGRGMTTADDDSEVGLFMPGRRGNTAEEVGAELSRLTARIGRGEPVEREFQADAGREEEAAEEKEEEEEEEERGRNMARHGRIDRGRPWYADFH